MNLKLIKETKDEIIINSCPDKQVMGGLFIVTAVLIAVAAFYCNYTLSYLFTFPVIVFLIIGIFCFSRNITTRFNKKYKKIISETSVYKYEVFNSVLVTSFLETMTSGSGESSHTQRYLVAIVKHDPKKKLFKKIERFEKLVNKIKKNGSDDSISSKIKMKIVKLHDNISDCLFDYVPLCNSYDDSLTWQVAEKIARELNVPVIDTCGEFLLCRQVEELNTSLKERLISNNQKFGIPEDRPSDVKVTVSDETMSILYPAEDTSGSKVFTSINIAILILSVIIGFTTSFILAIAALILPLTISAYIQFSLFQKENVINEILVNSDKLIIKIKNEIEKPIPLSYIEMMRVDMGSNEALSIVADDNIYKLPMPTNFSEWIIDRIEYFLVAAK